MARTQNKTCEVCLKVGEVSREYRPQPALHQKSRI